MRQVKVLFALFLFFSSKVNSQFNDLLIPELKNIRGHSLGIIYALHTDGGAYWIGSENGLYKYNGTDVNKISLLNLQHPISFIESLGSDLLVGTLGAGLILLDKETLTASKTFRDDQLTSNFTYSLEKFSNSEYLIATLEGIALLNLERNQIDNIVSLPNVFSVTSLNDLIIFSSNNQVLTTTLDGVVTEQLSFEFNNEDRIFINDLKVVNNLLIIATTHGAYYAEIIEGALQEPKILIEFDEIKTIFVKSKDEIWLSGETIISFSPATKDTSSLYPLNNLLKSQRIKYIDVFEKTLQGHISFAAPISGFSWLPLGILSISTPSLQSNPLETVEIQSRAIGGINSYFILENEIKSYDATKNTFVTVPIETSESFQFIEAFTNELLIASSDSNFYTVNTITKEVSFIHKFESSIVTMKTFENGVLVLLNNGSLFYRNEANNFIRLQTSFRADQIEVSNHTLLAVDYHAGVFSSSDLKNWRQIDSSILTDELPIDCIENSPTGTVYLCTGGFGILTLDYESNSLVRSKISDHISSSHIRGLAFEDQFIWIATNSGLFRFDLNSNMATRINSRIGISDSDFEYEGLFIDKFKGLLFVLGDRRTYSINLSLINSILEREKHKKIRINIESIKMSSVNGATTSLAGSASKGLLTIDNDVYLTELTLSTPDPIDQQFLKFEYRIRELTHEWTILESNTITLSALKAGNYTLEYRVIEPLSIAIQPVSSVSLIVEPPFFLSYQAFFLYLMLLVTLVVFIRIWKKKLKTSENIRMEVFAKQRTEVLNNKVNSLSKELEKTNSLFSSVSHEIRTPITLIAGWLSELTQNFDSSAKEKLEHAIHNTNRLTAIVDQMLSLQSNKSTVGYDSGFLDVLESLNIMIQVYKPLYSKRNIDVILTGKKHVYVKLTDDAFQNIFSNFITNAIKFSPDDSSIKVKVSVYGDVVKILIVDHGPGIKKSDIPLIFKRFSRLDSTSSKEGVGLGLALAKELLQIHDGDVTLDSKPANGTQFKVSLPCYFNVEKSGVRQFLSDKDFHSREKMNSLCAEPETQGKLRVLIVDDVLEMRDYYSTILKDVYECFFATNGKEALEIANKILPSAVISDVHMPVTSGISLTYSLRESKYNSSVPIILVSAITNEEVKLKCLEAKADDFLSKPFSKRELQIKLRHLISKRASYEVRDGNLEESIVETIDFSDFNLPTFEDEKDKRFYTKFLLIIQKHYQDDKFDREYASKLLNCADRHLNRKLNSIAGHTFAPFLRQYRLKKASKLLLLSDSVSNVAFDTGFSSASHFGSCFRDEFGMTPTQYIKRNKKPLEG